ncbi:formate dehydrogenase subunit delta [Rhodopila sp.]|uniref:formate dehydrogenase subunit delta n=1 Tax=Rhodopila sp. TaxID=2480087 RepID=UPI002CA995AA|nr:formate dehydrogenase subunit delta [Rhodopila sp.]HVZ07647.1 formate dehydrogenase subunit delta [Rhodopila sp.]
MSDDKLAYMANQIGRFFITQDPDTAADAVHDHLLKFWDPRMRRGIVTQLQAGQAHLDPPVRRAVERLAQEQSV